MSVLKSEHLWSMLEKAKRERSPGDVGVAYFVAWAMLDDLRTQQAQLATLRAERDQLRQQLAQRQVDAALADLDAAQLLSAQWPVRVSANTLGAIEALLAGDNNSVNATIVRIWIERAWQDISGDAQDGTTWQPNADGVLPCPWCGRIPDINDDAYFRADDGGKWGWLQCCGNGPEIRAGYRPLSEWRADAIAAWNRRATPPPDPQNEIERAIAATMELVRLLNEKGS